MSDLPQILYVSDVARLFRLSRGQAWRLVKSRKLGTPRQLGNGPLFLKREDVEEALEKAKLPDPEARRRSPTIPKPDPEIVARLEQYRARRGAARDSEGRAGGRR